MKNSKPVNAALSLVLGIVAVPHSALAQQAPEAAAVETISAPLPNQELLAAFKASHQDNVIIQRMGNDLDLFNNNSIVSTLGLWGHLENAEIKPFTLGYIAQMIKDAQADPQENTTQLYSDIINVIGMLRAPAELIGLPNDSKALDDADDRHSLEMLSSLIVDKSKSFTAADQTAFDTGRDVASYDSDLHTLQAAAAEVAKEAKNKQALDALIRSQQGLGF